MVGIDIGRHKALVTVADLAGSIVARHREDDVRRASSSADLLAVLRTAARGALAAGRHPAHRRRQCRGRHPRPGGLAAGHGHARARAAGLEIELARELRRSFRCPAQVENDANLAALAERRHGLARDAHTLVFIVLGASGSAPAS